MPIIRLLIMCIIALTLPGTAASASDPGDEPVPRVPTPGMVTMLDLGADKCTPCKLMAPILAELQKEYAGRASIIFIDVWKHKGQAQRFKLRAIPTQIFYDREGREVRRHVGFLDKKGIERILKELGVPQESGALAYPQIHVAGTRHIFDPIVEGIAVTHDFVVRNTGQGPLMIEQVKTD